MGGRKRVCGSRKRKEKRKGGGEDGTVPSNNDWALWMRGGDAQGCFFIFTGYGLLPARSRQTQARRNGLDGSVKGKKDAPEL